MLTDPQSITINSVAISLPRTTAGVNSGIYTSADGNTKLSLTHSYAKRTRRLIRLDVAKIAPDPLISAQNIRYTASTYLVVDLPITGFTAADMKLNTDGFIALLSASSGAIMTRLLGGES